LPLSGVSILLAVKWGKHPASQLKQLKTFATKSSQNEILGREATLSSRDNGLLGKKVTKSILTLGGVNSKFPTRSFANLGLSFAKIPHKYAVIART
jgi:hypothetical protein